MKVEWTDTALEQLWSIHEFLSLTSTENARHMVDRLLRRSQLVGRFPQSGRRVVEFDVPHVREVIEGQYRIVYTITPDRIDIVAVFHGRQQPPWEAEDE